RHLVGRGFPLAARDRPADRPGGRGGRRRHRRPRRLRLRRQPRSDRAAARNGAPGPAGDRGHGDRAGRRRVRGRGHRRRRGPGRFAGYRREPLRGRRGADGRPRDWPRDSRVALPPRRRPHAARTGHGALRRAGHLRPGLGGRRRGAGGYHPGRRPTRGDHADAHPLLV
ncbi:MAG: hypothetical protein AVDCRST_MAG49-558, partial [uncultured Thermomicrobiales bacterium]